MRHIKLILPLIITSLLCVSLIMTSCKVKYSLSGSSISPLAKTVSIAYFPNNAAMVSPTLSATLTDALQDKFMRQTKLNLVRQGGDLNFEGEIIGYTSTPAAVSGDEFTVTNRLTIVVRVRFTNSVEPILNFEKTFQAYSDYSSSRLLQQVEPELIPEIVTMLVNDIFNAATSNW